LLELEYLPLIFIVIYVGAIAIIFIFVIMLLNIRLSYLKETNIHFFGLGFLFLTIFILQALFTLRLDVVNFSNINYFFLSEITFFIQEIFNASDWFYTETNMKSVGFLIFYHYYFIFILLGFILLLALMGVIVLVSQKKFRSKSQIISKQVLKGFEKSIKNY
jgi:NADH-quinone oxidoreductase subunit J